MAQNERRIGPDDRRRANPEQLSLRGRRQLQEAALGTLAMAALVAITLFCAFTQVRWRRLTPEIVPVTTTYTKPETPPPAKTPTTPKPSERKVEARKTPEPSAAPSVTEEKSEPLPRVSVDEAIDAIEGNFNANIDRDHLARMAIESIVNQLDPYGHYFPSTEIDRFSEESPATISGLGLQLRESGDRVFVLGPIYGSPAHRAGLGEGDELLEVSRCAVASLTLDEITTALRGPKDSSVEIVVKKVGSDAPEKMTLNRAPLRRETVEGITRDERGEWNFWIDRGEGLAYIRIRSFDRETGTDFVEIVEKLRGDSLRGLVLDLRSNTGGILSAAVRIAEEFLESVPIVTTRGRFGPDQTFIAGSHEHKQTFSMAVLVDRLTSSSAEVLAAALQDHDRARVFGERTYGKGTVQRLIPVQAGQSMIKLTVGEYIRPNGKRLGKDQNLEDETDWGVSPNPGCELARTDVDIEKFQEDRALRALIRRRPLHEYGLQNDWRDYLLDFAVQELKREADTRTAESEPPPVG